MSASQPSNRLHRYAPSSRLLLYYLVFDQHGIVDRFPLADRKSCPIPSNIADFCNFPSVMKFDQSKPEAKFFTFATTSSYGATLYGACLRVFESSAESNSSPIHNPKILMVLSEWSLFSIFEVFLGYFYLASRKKHGQSAPSRAPIENYLMQLEDVEIPSDQGQQILLKFGCDVLPITRRSRFVPPALNTPFSILFDRLPVSTIALILQNILCEKQIIFVSDDISVLTPVQDLLLSLVHPLRWHHLYLPVASRSLFEALTRYKSPFISGTLKDIFHTFASSNALTINLDDGSVMSREESQLYRCEENEQLCSVLADNPKQRSTIYVFQCNVQRAIVSLLQSSIRPKSSSNSCMKSFGRQIRTSLAAQLFIAEYRRCVPGDLRLSNLQSYFESQSNIPRMEKVEPMFEPKIYPKEMRDYAMLYQSRIIPINNKRLDQILKKTNLGRKPYVRVKENEGQKLNPIRRKTLCNGATVMAAGFCNAAISKWQNNSARKYDDMPLNSWLAEHDNAEILKMLRANPLNMSTISVNSSVDSGKWASNSSDSQSIDGQEYVKGIEIDSDSMQKLETRIKTQNDTSSEKDGDVFEGLSENENEHDASTVYSVDSKKEISNNMLHCLQERNEFDAELLRNEFPRDEEKHASLFARIPKGKLECLVSPEAVCKALTFRMFMERAKAIAGCECDPLAINEQR